jgi:mono/diheme cytochrome c family protein
MVSCSSTIRIALALVLGATLSAAVNAQSPSGQTQPPKVKGVKAPPISSVEGRDNYVAYCAVCHGVDGTGNGPAAPAMKIAVPDLTTLAKRSGGKFDTSSVEYIIRGTGKIATPAHGVEDMPIWGEVFRNEDRSVNVLRIRNLVKYLQSIQK